MSDTSTSTEDSFSIIEDEDPSLQEKGKDLSLEEEEEILSLEEEEEEKEEEEEEKEEEEEEKEEEEERKDLSHEKEKDLALEEEDVSIQEEDEDEESQEERSESRTNETGKILKGEERNLPRYLEAKYPQSFRNWPILCLLNVEFITQIRMVMVYDDGNMALIVTKDQNVYSFYFDKDDLLKKSGESHIGFYPKKIEELCGEAIKTFACNSHIVMALTEEGKVFFWRFKEQNSFKMEEEMKVVKLETYYKYMGKKRIVDITCSNNHFLALTSDGDVYAWGNNHYGQIGTEKQPSVLKYTHRGYKINKYNFNYPRKVKRLRETKIASLACGSKFSMAISDEGKLFSWGRRYNENCKNDQWKIMRSYKGETYDPHPFKIIINKTIVKVACGFEHTLVLSNEGKIFGWGKNNKGQIGDPRCLFYYSPVTVKMPELVSDIAAYGNLSVAVSTNKTIYIWGECFGQQITVPVPTGFSTLHDAFAYTPTRVMHKPLIVSDNKDELPSPSESFGIDYLSSLFNYPEFGFNDPLVSDFIVCVGDQGCIYVNSYILSNRCQYFKNMFQHDQTKNNRSVRSKPERYIVSDFSYVIYKAFFKYLYTGKVDLPSETVLDLMKLADKYSETNLKEDCVLIIKSSITTSNVAFFYGRAIEYNIREVEEFCFQFASFHMKVVVQSNNYKQLDASIKDTFIQRAAEANLFKTKLFKTKLFLKQNSF